ncbi:MAG: hypothetical protein HUJ26_05375 [Planctomycetaceae bacterium]|nr:hypothetical protein [Planctomycetaceae bacterium]
MSEKRNLPPVINLLYTHNPFYLLSTCFVIYAIKQAFQPESGDYLDPWLLMASLSGFTLLSAVTAFVVVKFGKVWEDARSIVLILVLMFLAISVSFDELLNLHPEQGLGLLMFGFLFSIVVSEGLLRGLRIRFPAVYRIPFYLTLALFFVFPYYVSPEVTGLGLTPTRWRLLQFPMAAAILTLSLMPAVRFGSQLLKENGTPWKWPYYPWTIFAFLALAVVGRTYYLNISFDESFGPLSAMYTAFGLYHLIPFALAILVLLLEIALVEKKPGLLKRVMVLVGLLPVMAIPFRMNDPIYALFHARFTQTFGAPLCLTVYAVGAFYVYAWMRGIKQAEWGLSFALLLGCLIGPETTTLSRIDEVNWMPLAMLGALQTVQTIRLRSSLRGIAATVLMTCVLVILTHRSLDAHLVQTIPPHLILLGIMFCGFVFQDRAAYFFRKLAAISLPILAVATAWTCQSAGVAEGWLALYLVGMTTVPLGIWYVLRDRWYLASAMINVAGGSGGMSWMGYRFVRSEFGARIIEPLLYGTAFFLIAVMISAHKAGAFDRLFPKRNHNGHGPPPEEGPLIAGE